MSAPTAPPTERDYSVLAWDCQAVHLQPLGDTGGPGAPHTPAYRCANCNTHHTATTIREARWEHQTHLETVRRARRPLPDDLRKAHTWANRWFGLATTALVAWILTTVTVVLAEVFSAVARDAGAPFPSVDSAIVLNSTNGLLGLAALGWFFATQMNATDVWRRVDAHYADHWRTP